MLYTEMLTGVHLTLHARAETVAGQGHGDGELSPVSAVGTPQQPDHLRLRQVRVHVHHHRRAALHRQTERGLNTANSKIVIQ